MNHLRNAIILSVLSHAFVTSDLSAQDLIFTDSFEVCTAGETVDWDGGGDGTSWSDELNWEGDVLPVDGDAVSIRRGGLDTVIYNSGSETLKISCLGSTKSISFTGGTLEIDGPGWIGSSLTVTGGTLTTTGHLRVSGTVLQSSGTINGFGKLTAGGEFTWSGGTQKDFGETVADGGLVLSGAVRNLDGRTLTLNAPSSFTGGELRLWNGATINNNAQFDIKTDDNLRFLTGSNSTFNNSGSGTLIKSAGAGETAIQANFNNSGTVTISTGELHVGRTGASGSSTGIFDVASGALLGISGNNSLSGEIKGDGGLDCHVGGNTTISNIYTLSGPLSVGGVALTFDIPVTITGDVTVTNGTLAFTTAPTAINADVVMSNGTLTTPVDLPVSGSWTQSNGTLAGTGKVTIAGQMTWSGGTQKESGETVADGGLVLSGAVRNLDGRTLTLNAPSSFTGGELRLWNSATINNNALFDIKTDDNLRFLSGSNSTFNNSGSGTLIKSAGAGETAIQANFNNSGTVTISTGELHVGRTGASGSSTGIFDVASGALLGISGNNSLSGEIKGDGGLDCHVGGNTTISNIYTLSGPLSVGGVALTFDIPVTITGDVTVTNGTLAFTTAPTAINADVVMTNGTLTTPVDLPVSGSWTQSNGTLAGTGKVTIAGQMTWSGGTQKESGETVADGGLVLSGAVRNLDGRTLTLNAPSSFTGGELRLWNGATINNNAQFDIKTDDNLRFLTGSNSTFNNSGSGTLIKSAGAGETAIQANFNNSGTVTISTGELHVGRTGASGSSTGIFDVASGALLGISGNNSLSGEIKGDGGLDCHVGGNTTISNIYTLSGPLSVGGVALTFDIPVTITGDVTVTNGTLAFTTAPTAINADVVMSNGTLTTPVDLPVSGSWTQSNGTLAGTGKVTIAGQMTWSGGTQKESGETVADGGLVLSGAVRNLDGRTLTLNAPSSFTGGELRLWNGATINNNAQFDIKTDDNLRFLTGTNSTFNNSGSGTLIKSAGAGETAIQANFNNSGTVTISTGELHVGRTGASGSSTGIFDVASGALLGISGNNSLSGEIKGDGGLDCHVGGNTTISNIYTLSGPLSVGGVALTFDIPVTITGDVTVTNGTLAFTTAPTAINADVVMTNGTLTTPVDLPVSGSWTQSNGTLAGTGKVTIAGQMTWSGGTQKESGETVADGGLVLSGAVRNLDGRTLTLNAPSSFTGGELRLWNGATINNNAQFDIKTDDNFRFLTGSNSTFNNSGSGTLIKSAGAGETAIQANFNNSGTVSVDTGEISFGRTFTQDSAGTLDVHILGLSNFDVFAVTQSATLDGTVNIIRNGYAPPSTTAFDIMTCNTCSGAFSTVNGNGVTFTQTVAADKVTLTAD